MGVETSRSLSWWYFDDRKRFGLEGELSAAQGAVVAKALERVAESLPVMPGEEGLGAADARRADALVAMCSARISSDHDPDRATVVIHARLESLVTLHPGAEIEGGPAISPQSATRLACTGRIQMVIEDQADQVVQLGRITREPPAWMVRQLKYQDRVHLPGVRIPAVHPGPSHRVVGEGREDRSGQPGPAVHLPPPVGSRVRMEPVPGS